MNDTTFALENRFQLLKATDVATILNISRAMAYRLMQQGAIRTVCIGAARRVRSEDLQIYIEDHLTPSELEK